MLYIGIGAAIIIALTILIIWVYLPYLVDKRIGGFQQDLIIKHYTEVQHMYDQMRGWRHDYHNHIQAMQAFLALGQIDQHQEYLNKLNADLTSVDTVIKTGNVMVDAILNSKISIATDHSINVNAKAAVPEALAISEIDLCVIIGNLLDNAIEACAQIPETGGRFIRVYIGRHKSMLYISVSNATHGRPKKHEGRFGSTKNSPSHGFGLIRIDRIAAKCGGFINRQFEDGIFATEVTLPL